MLGPVGTFLRPPLMHRLERAVLLLRRQVLVRLLFGVFSFLRKNLVVAI